MLEELLVNNVWLVILLPSACFVAARRSGVGTTW